MVIELVISVSVTELCGSFSGRIDAVHDLTEPACKKVAKDQQHYEYYDEDKVFHGFALYMEALPDGFLFS